MKIKRLSILIFISLWACYINTEGQLTWNWSRQADSSTFENGTQIAADRNNNVYSTGSFGGSVMTFGNVRITSPSIGSDFLVKYDPNGNVQWARNGQGLAPFANIFGESVRTDRNNNVLETGYFSDSVAFGTYHLSAHGGIYNGYLVKYDGNGNVLWANAPTLPSSNDYCMPMWVAADKHNNIVQTGSFWGGVKFGNNTFTALGAINMFLVKYNANGNVLWATTPQNTSSFTYGLSVDIDDSGYIYASGNYEGSVTFGNTTLTSNSFFGNVFLVKYDSAGGLKWVVNIPAIQGTGVNPLPVHVDYAGNVYISAQFTNPSLTLGTNTLTDPATGGCSNSLLAKYDRNGHVLWARCANFESETEVCVIVESSITTDMCDNVYWAGLCADTFAVGNVKVEPPNNSNTSESFSFVMKLDENGTPLTGVAMLNGEADQNSDGVAVDSLSKVLFVGDLVTEPSLTLGPDVINRYLANSTAYFSKFSLGPPIVVGGGNSNSSDSICQGDSITLKVTPEDGATYLWNTGATTDSITVKPSSSTNYFAIVHVCYSDTSFINVTVLANNPVLSGPDSICQGDSAVLSVTGGVNYLWSTGQTTSTIKVFPANTTTYTLISTNNGRCGDTLTKTVHVAPEIVSRVSISRDTVCPHTAVTLTAQATGSNHITFDWSNGSTMASITVIDSMSTTYTVTINGGCNAVQYALPVTVMPEPAVQFRADVTQGCAPMCTQFRDESTLPVGSIAQWVWAFGTGDTSHEENPVYCYQRNGSYNVMLTATSEYGCSSTLLIDNMITVFSKPVAAFTFSPGNINILQPTVQFTDKSTDAYGIAYWVWNFGEDGDTLSNDENPWHNYRDTGSYCPSLAVVNENGCTDTATNCLVINPLFTLYIPDAFTPNGNGKNDVFEAKGNDVKSFEMFVFDRWGEQVFHSTDINEGWDGRSSAGTGICQEDTYIYVIKATDSRNNQHSYTGTVVLIK